MLIKKELILGTKDNPIIELEEHKINSDKFNFIEAEQELSNYAKNKAPDDLIWGYFPSLEKDEDNLYPQCIKLADLIKKFIIPDDNTNLSFIKYSAGKPNQEFGGLHIDDGINSIMAKRYDKDIFYTGKYK